MRNLKYALTLAAGLLVATAPVPALARDDAEDVAKKIYRIVEKACPEDGDGVPYNLASIAEAYFSPGLNDALRHAYEQRALGFDILIDAQDCAIGDVDVEVDDDDEERGQVFARARFRNYEERRDIRLVIVNTPVGWKVEDVYYRHRDWSARRDLVRHEDWSK